MKKMVIPHVIFLMLMLIASAGTIYAGTIPDDVGRKLYAEMYPGAEAQNTIKFGTLLEYKYTKNNPNQCDSLVADIEQTKRYFMRIAASCNEDYNQVYGTPVIVVQLTTQQQAKVGSPELICFPKLKHCSVLVERHPYGTSR